MYTHVSILHLMQLHPKFLCAIEHHHHVYLQLDSCRFISCVMNKIMLKRDLNLNMNIDELKIYSKHICLYFSLEFVKNIELLLMRIADNFGR